MTRDAAWTDVVSAALLAAWFLYLLLAPTVGFRWIESWHDEQRAVQVVLLAATALAFCAMLFDGRYRLQLPRIRWIVVAVFALGAVSATRATYADAAYAELALHFLLLVLVLVTAVAVGRNPARSLVLAQYGALLLLAAHVAGVAVQYAAAVSMRRALTVDVLILGYSNARFPSALHALLIPFVATLSVDPRHRRALRWLGFALLACTWAINLALATRAIWFAYAVALPILWAALGWRVLRPAVQATILSALAGALLYGLVFRGLPLWLGMGESFQKRTFDQLIWGSNRELLIRSSLEAIRSAPWLGIGPMQFAAVPKVWAAHPHNWVLQLASEWGLPAATLAVYGTMMLLRQAGRRVAGALTDHVPLASFVAASVVALVYGLVDGNLVMPVSQSATSLVFGGLVAASRPLAANGVDNTRASSAVAAVGIALLAVISAVCLAVFTARTVGPMTVFEQATASSRTLWPRFWSDGFLPFKSD